MPLARDQTIYAQENTLPNAPVTQSKTVSKLYIPTGASSTLLKDGSGDTALLIQDHLTSTRVVETGNATQKQEYYPYGTTNGEANTISDKQFTGHRSLTDTGVYHAGARFYSSQLGQFIQGDKVLFMRGSEHTDEKVSSITQDYSSSNMFKYARNNPLLYVDRDGADAVLVFDSQSVFGAAHVSVLMENNNNDWHYYSWGSNSGIPLDPKKNINIERVPDSFSYFDENGAGLTIDPTESLDNLNVWLNETFDGQKPLYRGTYDKMVYIKGNFANAVPLAYERKKLNEGSSMFNPLSWYNLANRNCLHECLSMLKAGELDKSYGEGLISDAKNNAIIFLSSVLRVPIFAYNGLLKNNFDNQSDMHIFSMDVVETSDLQSLLMRGQHNRPIAN